MGGYFVNRFEQTAIYSDDVHGDQAPKIGTACDVSPRILFSSQLGLHVSPAAIMFFGEDLSMVPSGRSLATGSLGRGRMVVGGISMGSERSRLALQRVRIRVR